MNNLIRLVILIGLCLPAMAQEPKIITTLSPTSAWVGQRSTLVIELLSPTYFSGTPAFDLPQIPGVVIFKPAGHPILDTRQIADTTYTVQRHELWIYANRAGPVTIPAIPVRFDITSAAGAVPKSIVLNADPVSLEAKLPPGAEHISSLISTTYLTAQGQWRPTTRQAHVGDAFTHEITLSAAGVPGMAFPPLPDVPVAGLSIYRQPPQVSDESDRADIQGQRIETITYVCQSPGTFTVPAYALKWWDLQNHTLKTAVIPGLEITVAPDASATSTPSPLPNKSHRLAVIAAGAAALLLVFLWLFKDRLCQWRAAHRQRIANSEPALFRNLLRTSKTGDLRATYRQLLTWWHAIAPAPSASSVVTYLATLGEIPLAQAVAALEKHLFAPASPLNPTTYEKDFAALLHHGRKHLLSQDSRRHAPRRTLAPLNSLTP